MESLKIFAKTICKTASKFLNSYHQVLINRRIKSNDKTYKCTFPRQHCLGLFFLMCFNNTKLFRHTLNTQQTISADIVFFSENVSISLGTYYHNYRFIMSLRVHDAGVTFLFWSRGVESSSSLRQNKYGDWICFSSLS